MGNELTTKIETKTNRHLEKKPPDALKRVFFLALIITSSFVLFFRRQHPDGPRPHPRCGVPARGVRPPVLYGASPRPADPDRRRRTHREHPLRARVGGLGARAQGVGRRAQVEVQLGRERQRLGVEVHRLPGHALLHGAAEPAVGQVQRSLHYIVAQCF